MSNTSVDNGSSKDHIVDYMRRHNIDPYDPREDLPTKAFDTNVVPMRGTVMESLGRTKSRDQIDAAYLHMKFAKIPFWYRLAVKVKWLRPLIGIEK